MSSLEIQKGDTLWNNGKQCAQVQNCKEQKVTNQQIIDEMKRLSENPENKTNRNGTAAYDDLSVQQARLEDLKVNNAPTDAIKAQEKPVAKVRVECDMEAASDYLDAQLLKLLVLKANNAPTYAIKAQEKFVAKIRAERDMEVARDYTKTQHARLKNLEANNAPTDAIKAQEKFVAEAEENYQASMAEADCAWYAYYSKNEIKPILSDEFKHAQNVVRVEEGKLRELKRNKASADDIAKQEKALRKAKDDLYKAIKTETAKRKAAKLKQQTSQSPKK